MLQPQRRLDKVEDSLKLCPRSASRCSATQASVRVKDKVSSTVTVRGPNTRSARINSYLNSSSNPTPEHMSSTALLDSLSNRNRTAGRTSPKQSCDCQAILELQSISTTSAKPCMGCLSGLAPSLSITGRTFEGEMKKTCAALYKATRRPLRFKHGHVPMLSGLPGSEAPTARTGKLLCSHLRFRKPLKLATMQISQHASVGCPILNDELAEVKRCLHRWLKYLQSSVCWMFCTLIREH